VAGPVPADGGGLAMDSWTPDETGFEIRRIPNPRYRVRSVAPLASGATPRGRIQALDHLHVQLGRRGGDGGGPAATDWDAALGEDGATGDRYLLTAAGSGRHGRATLRSARFEADRGPSRFAFGDVPPVALLPGRTAVHGLRGAGMVREGREGRAWGVAMGGPATAGPTPSSLLLAAAALRGLPFDVARLSASALVYTTRTGPGGGDSVSAAVGGGLGAETGLGWTAPLAGGALSGDLVAQLNAPGPRGRLAVQHGLAWEITAPRIVASIQDRRGSPALRRLTAARLGPEATSDTRWTIQSRHRGGRVEGHCAGALRGGGDPQLESRTFQLGGTAALGRSAWQVRAESGWERRIGTPQHRLAVSMARFGGGPVMLLGRLERVTTVAAPVRHLLTGDLMVPIEGGARVTFQPRLGWQGAGLDHGTAALRLRWPIGSAGGNLTASVAGGMDGSQGRGVRLQEVSLVFLWVPGSRDRATVEARRISEGSESRMEYAAGYDLQFDRFAGAPGSRAADSGTVMVRVLGTGNGDGIADVLVSLDGTELRFTDAHGVARFDRVPPGVHAVVVDEGSLPQHHRITGPTRAFVMVERGAPAPSAVFEVARPTRRSSF